MAAAYRGSRSADAGIGTAKGAVPAGMVRQFERSFGNGLLPFPRRHALSHVPVRPPAVSGDGRARHHRKLASGRRSTTAMPMSFSRHPAP